MTIKGKTYSERMYHEVKTACDNRGVDINYCDKTDTLVINGIWVTTLYEAEDIIEKFNRRDKI